MAQAPMARAGAQSINNMTHELKTPISSISLAAQMLNDESVGKSPQMMNHLGGVINDESKRLRFLVEKVLQMSMFDRKTAAFKKKELDLNELLENTASTFSLRVEHTGGHIYTEIEAIDSAIYVDEVHFTNAITNLMGNQTISDEYAAGGLPAGCIAAEFAELGLMVAAVADPV